MLTIRREDPNSRKNTKKGQYLYYSMLYLKMFAMNFINLKTNICSTCGFGSFCYYTAICRIKSETIRKQWKVEEIIDDIQNYQQKWNQRVLKMPENRQYRPQGKRYLGRPYRRWKDEFM